MQNVKKILTTLLFCITTSSGCSSGNSPATVTVPARVNSTKVNAEAGKIIIDVGKGKKGGNVGINFNFKDGFKIKSADGERPALISDITFIKLYLTTSRTNPLEASALKADSSSVVYTDGKIPVSFPTSSNFVFSNVQDGGPYYIAAELFDDEGNNLYEDIGNRLINPLPYDSANLGDTAFGFTDGKRGLTLSTEGIKVNLDHTIVYTDEFGADQFPQPTDFHPLLITPVLIPALGATIDSTVTVEDDGLPLTGIIDVSCEPVCEDPPPP